MISPARASSEIAKTSLKEGASAPQSGLFGRLRGMLPAVAERLGTLIPAFGAHDATVPAPRSSQLAPRRGAGRTITSTRAIRITRRQLAIISFLVCVAAPTALAYLYLAGLAAPQYRSEARFVVRGNLEAVAGSGPAVGGIPQVPSSQEGRVVVDYLRSRAMVDTLQQQMDLHRIFGGHPLDPVFSLSPHATEEQIVAYWNRQVQVTLESMSGVIKIQVDAFSPESAALLAAAIIREAEQVTNDLTIRNRGDRVLQAGAEERVAFTDLALVRSEIETFRNAQGTLDPTRSAAEAYIMIARLRDQRSSLNTDLTAARARLDADSPVVRALSERLRTLDDKIKALDTQLLGRSKDEPGSSDNLKAGAELEARRRLAEQRLRQAEAELLDARTEQAKKQVYILTFLAPTLPAEKVFPRPGPQTMGVFAVLAACWALVVLYVGSIYARTR